jgi:hypothetical protein
MMINDLANLQLQDLNLVLPGWEALSMENVDWLFKKLQKKLEYSLVRATQF